MREREREKERRRKCYREARDIEGEREGDIEEWRQRPRGMEREREMERGRKMERGRECRGGGEDYQADRPNVKMEMW